MWAPSGTDAGAQVLVLLIPYGLALLAAPLAIRLAHRLGALDLPDARKRHSEPVPLLGGLVVLFAAIVGLALAYRFVAIDHLPPIFWVMGAGAIGMAGVGLYDDLFDLRAPVKLCFQLAIAGLSWLGGLQIGEVELPLGWFVIDAWLPSLVITVLWITLITNAFNYIDGLDGLATGIGLITMLTMFVVANEGLELAVPLGALAVAGALAGFLRFNLPPARIFLGDCGALALGYAAAVLAIGSYQKAPTAMVVVVPLLAIGLPIVDILVMTVRRFLDHLRQRGVGGLGLRQVANAVFRADRGHIHFLLLRLGWRPMAVLALLYGLSIGLAGLALWTRFASPNLRWGVLLAAIGLGYVGVRLLERRANAGAPRGSDGTSVVAHARKDPTKRAAV